MTSKLVLFSLLFLAPFSAGYCQKTAHATVSKATAADLENHGKEIADLLAESKFSQALNLCDESIHTAPSDHQKKLALYRKSIALCGLHNFANALPILQQGLLISDLDKGLSSNMLSSKAGLQIQLKDLPGAVKTLGEAIAVYPARPIHGTTLLLYDRANALIIMRKYPEAMADIESGLKLCNDLESRPGKYEIVNARSDRIKLLYKKSALDKLMGNLDAATKDRAMADKLTEDF